MSKKKKIIFTIVAIVIIAAIAVAAVFLIKKSHQPKLENKAPVFTDLGKYDKCVTDMYSADLEKNKKEIESACKLEEDFFKDPNDAKNFSNFLKAATEWKTLGDNIHQQKFYNRSIDMYKYRIDNIQDNSFLVRWNVYDLYLTMRDYKSAEPNIIRAKELNNMEAQPYLALVELYRYNMKDTKTADDIIKVYDEALTNVVVGHESIVDGFKEYMESIGRSGEVDGHLKK